MEFGPRRDVDADRIEADGFDLSEIPKQSEEVSVKPEARENWWLPSSYGEPSTFGSQPWHTPRNWWKAPTSGEANDVRSQFSTTGRLACAATSLRGNKHRLQGAVNQDSFSVISVTSKEGEQFLIVAVCDGMGSATYSSFAARAAASFATATLARGVSSLGLEMVGILEQRQEEFIKQLRSNVLNYREGEFDSPPMLAASADPGELQTTLSFAVIGPADTDEVVAVTGWIGDSPVILIQDSNWVHVSREQETDGLHSTASQGLMTTDRLSLRRDDLSIGDGLLVCSDGVGNFIEYKGAETALGRDLRERWGTPPERLEFIRDLSFDIQSADDDRTAVMVWHR